MVIVLVIGLSVVAVLAVYLKRRHARKLDERSATLGSLAPQGASSPDIGHRQDMWGPHQYMAYTGGWEYTAEQDREISNASASAGHRALGSALGTTKSLKGTGKRRLSKRSKYGSQRSARDTETVTTGLTAGEDANTKEAMATVRRSRSEQRREREKYRERDKEVERGWPVKNHDEKLRKDGQRTDVDERSRLEETSGNKEGIS